MKSLDQTKIEHNIHMIFFYGLGSNCIFSHNYKPKEVNYAKKHARLLINRLEKINMGVHVHQYPAQCEYFTCYLIVSTSLFMLSILSPMYVLYRKQITAVNICIASLTLLVIISLSILIIAIPFIMLMHNEQALFQSTIEKIDQLIDVGVKPDDIVLFGYCFGGAMLCKVLKHYVERGIKLGNIVLVNTFSSLEDLIKNSAIPQIKILKIIPKSLFSRTLKLLNLDLNLANDIEKLYGEKKLSNLITIIDSTNDKLVLQDARLGYRIKNLEGGVIRIKTQDANHINVLRDEIINTTLYDAIIATVDANLNTHYP